MLEKLNKLKEKDKDFDCIIFDENKGKYFCKLCNKIFNNKRLDKIKRHKSKCHLSENERMNKKLDKWRKTNKDFKCLEIIKTVEGEFMFFCDICKKILGKKKKDIFIDHFSSQIHKQKEDLLITGNQPLDSGNKKTKTLKDPKKSLQKWKEEDERFECIEHIEGNSFKCTKCCIKLTGNCKFDLDKHLKSDKHMGGKKEPKELKFPKEWLNEWQRNEKYKSIEHRNGNKFYCNLCKIEFNITQKSNYTAHIRRIKHKNSLSQLNQQQQFDEDTERASILSMGPQRGIHIGESIQQSSAQNTSSEGKGKAIEEQKESTDSD
ncbi:hypothetical protein Mgra_00007538 [Meloidogyne graminicola]|uniref:U1-type domain-containing protein n=1 Tax=Meloidogyne graminicola TaxID=189291 RepID=A0A8S9ZI40_9BILA|nr:hypothetical protein Mgra_00007538 [Meloidogyne graminicola]